MKGTAEIVSGIGAIINVERFSFLERMLRVTAHVWRFCAKLFKRLIGNANKLVRIKDVMKETCLIVMSW